MQSWKIKTVRVVNLGDFTPDFLRLGADDTALRSSFRELAVEMGINRTMGACRQCEASLGSASPVLPSGSLSSKYVHIWRTPTQEDVLENKINSGHNAQHTEWYAEWLEELALLGTTSGDNYFTSALLCRTPRDRAPLSRELKNCGLWKLLEWEMLSNRGYVFLWGNDATRQFFGSDFHSLLRIYHDLYIIREGGKQYLVIPCYHPCFVSLNDELKREQRRFIADVREIIELLGD